MATSSWKSQVSVWGIFLTSCRPSENQLQDTQQTKEQAANVLKRILEKFRRVSWEKHFNLFFFKFFEKGFYITCIFRPVCAIIQRNNLKKRKNFLFLNFFPILSEQKLEIGINSLPGCQNCTSRVQRNSLRRISIFKKKLFESVEQIFLESSTKAFQQGF